MFLFYLQIIIHICPTYVLVGKACKCSLYSVKKFVNLANICHLTDGPSHLVYS